MAKMPRGAVASILEKEATKNTIFFDDFTTVPFVLSNPSFFQIRRSFKSVVLSSPGQRIAAWLAFYSVADVFANYKTHTISTASPMNVFKLLKLCKIQQA
jgi:hypothetical protein